MAATEMTTTIETAFSPAASAPPTKEMTTLTEFTLFTNLPIEIRLLIWGHVRPPTRLIGLMIPHDAWNCQSRRRRHPLSEPEPWSTFRYVVQPSNKLVFPPLHVSQEARAFWLARMVPVPRSRGIVWKPDRPDGSGSQTYTVLFDTPFINYKNDIFTVMGAWPPGGHFISGDPVDHARECIDPFVCLDRTLIRNVGLCDFTYNAQKMLTLLDPHRLPALEKLSLVSLGLGKQSGMPPGEEHQVGFFEWPEMPIADVQNHHCQVHTLAPDIIASHEFFNDNRARQEIPTSPIIRALPQFVIFVKAWLWHEHGRVKGARTGAFMPYDSAIWFNFVEYLLYGSDGDCCPLLSSRCGVDGHTRQEMLQWMPDFDIDHRLLCMREWVEAMRDKGVLTVCEA